MEFKEFLDVATAKGDSASIRIKRILVLYCGVGIYVWLVAIFGLMLGDIINYPLDIWSTSAYAEADLKADIAKKALLDELAPQVNLVKDPLLQKRILKCHKVNSALLLITGATMVDCEKITVSTGTVNTGTVVLTSNTGTVVLTSTATIVSSPVATSYIVAGTGLPSGIPFKGWRVNKNGVIKGYIPLDGSDKKSRIRSLLDRYGLRDTYQSWVMAGYDYGIKPEFLICVAWADSDLGAALKTTHNYGNVGNNDRGNRVHYGSADDGIRAIGKVLNNQYLGYKQSVGSLSPGGGGTGKFYATSPDNWNANVLNCLNMIAGDKAVENEDSLFRE